VIAEAQNGSNIVPESEPLPSSNQTEHPSHSAGSTSNAGSVEKANPIPEEPAPVRSDDVVIDASEIQFMAPVEGTPAAEALAANAQLKVTKFDKGLRKIRGIKHPKLKAFKRKKEGRKFSRNFKGKTIEGIHEQYTLTIGMMLGIRVSIGGRYNVNAASTLLTLEDFSYVQKINFPPNGNNTPPFITPPHSLAHTFKFKTYAPKVFEKIREFFNVDSASYMTSVCGDFNYIEFISNSKSGQFFFYSHDGRYMIKTQTKDENQFMKRILPHYYKYVSENPNTLLVKIFGMHRVKMYHLQRKIHFVIMGSVFDTTEVIHQIYDLKGSLVGRNATPKERANGGVLKDKDLIDDGVKFHLGAKKAAFIEQIKKDARFLASLNIMDYSLLVSEL
jgi:1-phosphatidylinositol-4-phosphate 5-kinase